MKTKVAILVSISLLLFSCAPDTSTQEDEVVEVVTEEIATEEPASQLVKTEEPVITEEPTETPAATPTQGYVDSGINFWLPSLQLMCDIGTVAGNSYLQILPDSCSFIDLNGTQRINQNMPPMFNTMYSFTLIEENNKPVDFGRFPVNGIIDGWGIPDSKIGVMFKSPYIYGLMRIDNNPSSVNIGAVILKDGRVVLFNIVSAGEAPTSLPGIIPPDGNDSGNNNTTPPTDPPPPTEEPHGGEDDPPEPTDVPAG